MNAPVRCLTILAVAAGMLACGEPVSPPGTPAHAPSLAISDGAHGGGNPGFFFLPPLVPSPSGNSEYGDSPFATVSPVVRICRLAGNPSVAPTVCEAELIAFSGSQIRVSIADRQYSVNWDTKTTDLSTSAFYRIAVYVGTQMLGFADVDPVTPQEMRNARTGDVFTLLDGRTLPIKFTIEEDGLCTGTGECTIVRVTNAGGSFTLPSGNGGIYLPEGWLPPGYPEVSLTLQRIPTGPDNDCLEEGFTGPGLIRQYEGCMSITTAPSLTGSAGIQQEAVVGLCLEIPSTHPDYHYVRLVKSDAGRPLVLLDDASPSVIAGFTCAGFAGTPPPSTIGSLPAPLRHLASAAFRGTRAIGRLVSVEPLYAIDLGEGGRMLIGETFSHFGWGIQGTLSAASPTTVGTGLGTYTTLSARVNTNHLHSGAPSSGTELQNIPVVFTIVSGAGGQMVEAGGQSYVTGPLTVLTDEAGEARIDFLPGTTPATYVVEATSNALGSPMTFTVHGGSTILDFETWPATTDGPCIPGCSLSTQYSPIAQFSFAPAGGAVAGLPALRVAGGPYHASTNHSASVPLTTDGYAVGTIGMLLGGNPIQTTFRIRYSPTAAPPQVTAYGYDPIDGVPIPIAGGVTITMVDGMAPSGAPMREATVTVAVPAGIHRIDVSGGSSSDTIYLDDVIITGAVFPPIG